MISFSLPSFYSWFIRMMLWALFIFIGLILAFEVYNPFEWNKRPGKPYQTVRWANPGIVGLPNNLILQFNNIGCVGPNLTESTMPNRIFFVGSSTTKNTVTPFEKQWMSVAMQGIPGWYNNVGINGTSVHQWRMVVATLKPYKPTCIVILFALGKMPHPPRKWRPPFTSLSWIRETAFMKSLVMPFVKSIRLGEHYNDLKIVKWREIPYRTKPDKAIDPLHMADMMRGADTLIDDIKKMGAVPIIISQPTPFGKYMADGRDVGKMLDSEYIDGIYNELSVQLKTLCLNKNVHFIDGYAFPKTFDYYYDIEHFNVAGNVAFGEYIKKPLTTYLLAN